MGDRKNARKRVPKADRTRAHLAATSSVANLSPPATPRPQPRPRIKINGPAPQSPSAMPPNKENIPDMHTVNAARAMVSLCGANAPQTAEGFGVMVDRVLGIDESLDGSERDAGSADEEGSELGEGEEQDELLGDVTDHENSSVVEDLRAFFPIPIEVKDDTSLVDLHGITSHSSFASVLHAVAAKLNVRISHLAKLGYIPSWLPKSSKPIPKLLEDEQAWEVLLDKCEAFILTAKEKAMKGRKKDAAPSTVFTITMMDTSGSVKKTIKADVKKRRSSTSPDRGGESANSSVTNEAQAQLQIEKKHYCAACKKPCRILDNGDHYQYTMNDLATWAWLLTRHRAVLASPPDELNLGATLPRQRQAKAAAAKAESETSRANSDMPPWMQQLMISNQMASQSTNQMMTALAGAMVLHLPTAIAPSLAATPAPVLQEAPTVSSSDVDGEVLSRKRAMSTYRVQYPSLQDWLSDLDKDIDRLRIGIVYGGYADRLADNDVVDLCDLLRLSPEKLVELGGMKYGTATRLLDFAKDDEAQLITDVTKRAHVG